MINLQRIIDQLPEGSEAKMRAELIQAIENVAKDTAEAIKDGRLDLIEPFLHRGVADKNRIIAKYRNQFPSGGITPD